MSSEKSKIGLRLLQFYKKVDHASGKLSIMWSSDELPYSLKSCLAFVYHHNIEAKHVLRKNGNKVAHEVLCSYLKKNKDVAPTFYVSGVYDVCSAIKAYVKDIPEGLLVKNLEHDWHKIVRLDKEVKVREKLKIVIQKLPIANRNMLFHLLFLAAEVSEHRHRNEMSSKSLSIVLMPSMFERVIDITKMRDFNGVYDLLEFMIDNAAEMMGRDLYGKIEASLKDIGGRLRIVQELQEEPDSPTEDKQAQFVSQDSGLNSTSFIDEKSSQSLSSLNKASERDISSIEDLLDSSGVDCRRRQQVCRSSTVVYQLKAVASEDSSCCVPDRSDSRGSLSSTEEEAGPEARWRSGKQRVNRGLTCVGLQHHNIKECRPYSVCASSLATDPVASRGVPRYSPVYDRALLARAGPASILSPPSDAPPLVSPPSLQRKKPVLKRSSCIVGPLPPASSHLSATHSLSLQPASCDAPDGAPCSSPCPSPPSTSRTRKTQIFLKQKLRTKRKPLLFRNRLSVPIKDDDVEAPVLPSQRVIRAASLQHGVAPLPIDVFLRQRSSEETFV